MFIRKDTNQNNAVKLVEWKIKKYEIVLFTRGYCPEGRICQKLIKKCTGVNEDNFDVVHFEKRGDSTQVDDYLWVLSGEDNRGGPQVFIRGDYLCGYPKLLQLYESGKLQRIINNLRNFSPGQSNYLDHDPSHNLALEGDPDILPDMIHSSIPPEENGIIIKVCELDSKISRVDCSHFSMRQRQDSISWSALFEPSLYPEPGENEDEPTDDEEGSAPELEKRANSKSALILIDKPGPQEATSSMLNYAIRLNSKHQITVPMPILGARMSLKQPKVSNPPTPTNKSSSVQSERSKSTTETALSSTQ